MQDDSIEIEKFYEHVGSSPQDNYAKGALSAKSGKRIRDLSLDSDDDSKSIKAPALSASAWAQKGDVFYGVNQTHQQIPAGIYAPGFVETVGPILNHINITTDSLIHLPDSASESVLEEIIKFRGMEAKFREHGFLYKRGVLLWGPAGSGKTVTLNLLCDLLVNKASGIGLMVDHPSPAAQCLQLIRKIEPTRPIVVLLEDLDALVAKWGETEFLSLLDGEAQVDGIVYLATTNYPERLDKRFVDRPSRFDTVRYIGFPSKESRAVYLQAKMPNIESAILEEMVQKSDGFTVAHLRELIVLTQCFEHTVDFAVSRLRRMRVSPSSAKSPDRNGPGFTTPF